MATPVGVPVLSGGAIMACVAALVVAWPHGVLGHVEVELEIFDPLQLFRITISLERGENLVPLPELPVVLRG